MPEERIGPSTAYWYERHLFAYRRATEAIGDTAQTVVDLGCGKGYGLSELSYRNRSVIGIDRHVETLLDITTGDSISLVAGDIERIPLQSGCVHALVSFQVIEHLKHPAAYLAEAKRVLRPGGTLFLTTPNARRSDRGIEFRSPWHVHEYVWGELEHLLRKYFDVAHLQGIDLRSGSNIERSDRVVSTGEKLDPLRLRRLMPRRLRTGMLRLMGYVPPAQAGVTVDDFMFTNSETSRTVDLWAECRRPRD